MQGVRGLPNDSYQPHLCFECIDPQNTIHTVICSHSFHIATFVFWPLVLRCRMYSSVQIHQLVQLKTQMSQCDLCVYTVIVSCCIAKADQKLLLCDTQRQE